jgi:hypothetical protein
MPLIFVVDLCHQCGRHHRHHRHHHHCHHHHHHPHVTCFQRYLSTTKSLLVKLKELDEKCAPARLTSSTRPHPYSHSSNPSPPLFPLLLFRRRCKTQRGTASLDDLPQQNQSSLRNQLDRVAAERDQFREELNLERARARAWNGLADDTLQFLLRAMSDASAALADPSSLVPWTPADGVPARLESLSNEQRVRAALCAANYA